jgi:hypothetical protein
MRRFTITQKGQPGSQIALDARRGNTPSGYIVPPGREVQYGHWAATQMAETPRLLAGGLHPTTAPLMPLGALDIVDVDQAPLYRVPSANQVIDSAMNHPTNPGSRMVSESLGSALARAARLYF